MTFDQAFAIVLPIETGGDPEGGLTRDPHDPGGTTRWGISQRAHPELDVANLTHDQAQDLYRKVYWGNCGIEGLPDSVRLIAFDCAVNQGLGTAHMLLNQMRAGTKEESAWPLILLGLRIEHYAADRNWDKFGKGWMNRLAKIVRASTA